MCGLQIGSSLVDIDSRSYVTAHFLGLQNYFAENGWKSGAKVLGFDFTAILSDEAPFWL